MHLLALVLHVHRRHDSGMERLSIVSWWHRQVIEHWTFSLFFCIAELWGSVVISVLFWTLANDVCTVADAKVIYPLMGQSCYPTPISENVKAAAGRP